MPQTEEEHLIGLEEENESAEGGKGLDSHKSAEHDVEVNILSTKYQFMKYIL